MNKPPRQSNFELLRLLAMLAIVSGHLFTEGHLIAHASDGTLLPSLLLGCGARVATNLFVLLGCWFLVDATKPGAPAFAPGRRWLRLHFTVLCWAAPLTVLALAMGAHPGLKDAARGFVPYLGRPLWFASAWLTLLLAVPFLRHALALGARRLGALVGVGFLVFVVQSTIADFREGFLVDTLWFFYVYLAAGWLRLHGGRLLARIPAPAALVVGLALYASLVLPEWLARTFWDSSAAAPAVHALAERFLADLKSAPNALCALALFVFFAKLRMRPRRFLNALARPAFAVYVAHQTPAFWPLLWPRIVRTPEWWGQWWTPIAAVGAVLAVYGAVALVEALRLRLVEPLWTRSRAFAFLAGRIDRFVRPPCAAGTDAADADELAARVAARCGESGIRVAAAESCTGGLVGAALAGRPGASAWFRGAVVSYATETKRDLFGVGAGMLASLGPVSAPVAEAMAEGARRLLGADLAVSVTGLAGPDGDPAHPSLPVGTVFVGWADAFGGAGHEKHVFEGGRDDVRRAARDAALALLLRRLG